MMDWIKTAPLAALSLATALAAAGCLAPPPEESDADEATTTTSPVPEGEESTGDAQEAWINGCNGFGGFGCPCGFPISGDGDNDFFFRRFPGPCAPWAWCGIQPFLRFSDGIGGCF